jgi:hypothetical protein
MTIANTESQGSRVKFRYATRDEAGSILVVALIFLSAVSIIVASLMGSAGNDLKNTVNFENDRSTLYAAAGATQVAIWYARYSATVVGPSVACPGTNVEGSIGTITVSGQAMAVWCTTTAPSPALLPPNNFVTRIVKVSACPATESGSTGCSSPLVKAVLYIDDYSNSTGSTPGIIECSQVDESTCGTGMSVNSWVEK